MCKYIWAIANQQESLWLRWVHSVYIKRDSWWSYKASIHSSWYWRKLAAVKEPLKTIQNPIEFQEKKYVIAEGYDLLKPNHDKVAWSREVWARLNIPKHSVILWLAMLNRLKTKERLVKFGIQIESRCRLCNAHSENTQHLFFNCSFPEKCLQAAKNWLVWGTAANELPLILRWIRKAKISKFRKNVLAAVIVGLVYRIWEARNKLEWQNEQPKSDGGCSVENQNSGDYVFA
ncbi:uncharacterized protein LOC133038082 [Cannabis sativa]|uniref:uncharacterized protein LOC133038082 n=1 Tax=Cannabis sativa TaxID=3483 RepID=UPI0029C9F8F1|nr:uncharacterized protein LOC133038082 [Cannabis sativa]